MFALFVLCVCVLMTFWIKFAGIIVCKIENCNSPVIPYIKGTFENLPRDMALLGKIDLFSIEKSDPCLARQRSSQGKIKSPLINNKEIKELFLDHPIFYGTFGRRFSLKSSHLFCLCIVFMFGNPEESMHFTFSPPPSPKEGFMYISLFHLNG